MLIVVLLLLSILFIVISTTRFHLHAFLALIVAALFFGICSPMPLREVVSSIERGFGETIGRIGIVIVAGAIIGAFLDKSGGAYALAERILKVIGRKNVTPAMALIGYIVSIPVFADSGFVILAPLNKTLTKRAGLSLATTAIALALGLMVAHTLVPPTPGPIAAAGILEADLGWVLLIGIPVSILTLFFCWFWAVKVAGRVQIDPNPELTEEEFTARRKTAPSAFHAFLPILVPIVLIVLKSIADYPTHPLGQNGLYRGVSFVGTPLIALLIGIGIAMTLPKPLDRNMLSSSGWVGEGMQAAAMIILITGAGGAFGRVLQNSGIADTIGESMSSMSMGLWLPFMAAAAIRAAQGSSTVAIITTASIVAPMLASMGLDSPLGRALAVLAIGAGSMVASHANDSFFWVVTQMSGMDVKTGYKLMTAGTTCMGVLACTIIWIIGLIVL
ncbi:GntP family permease [Anaerobaca lacustris]|uniref:GntP family permease n=1 Tax=Anaerobaca lacustris TaxID=3044600 RepID=A0AAW6TX37_9BACT|nr:GntP family permease [Sedimentisphaerales bacterium M17dextr]